MKSDRRGAIWLMLLGLLTPWLLWGARRGIPGAKMLATRFGPPVRPQVQTETYGYNEVKLS